MFQERKGRAISSLKRATAPDVVARLNRELNTMLKAADFVEGLDKVGAEPAGGTPEQFAKTYRDESEGWKPLIRRAGIKPE